MPIENRCALVLGGGGPLGIAWEAGMLEGWAQSWGQSWARDHSAGQPLAPLLAGRIIGTSAGAIVGAHLAAHGSVTALVADQHAPAGADSPKGLRVAGFLAAFAKAKLFSRSLTGLRRSMGKSARSAARPGEAEFVAAIARSYTPAGAPDGAWPRELLLTAVDAETGEFYAWSGASGVPLALAIAASCAAPCVFPLVHVHGRATMDGGTGSPTNAGLAAGCARVLILDPLGRLLGRYSPLEAERRGLETAGSHTLAFMPDRAVADAMGRHVFDVAQRSVVATLGQAQGAPCKLRAAQEVREPLIKHASYSGDSSTLILTRC